MEDVANFSGSLHVVAYHWVWMLVALGLGIWTGWYTGGSTRN